VLLCSGVRRTRLEVQSISKVVVKVAALKVILGTHPLGNVAKVLGELGEPDLELLDFGAAPDNR
jgi:hypothetical protein